MMTRTIFLLWLAAALPAGQAALAQEQAQAQVWVQIEARPTEAEAAERARAYATVFPDVSGFRLASGWYGIVLGPYGPEVARLRLDDLLGAGMIPRDSFIADGRNFREPFASPGTLTGPSPEGEAMAVPRPETLPRDEPPVDPGPDGAPPAPEEAEDEPPAVLAPPPAAPAPAVAPDETPAEARRSEAALTPEERRQIQAALQWFGFYGSAIDGAFGSGTRASMAAWQEAAGAEPTGVLTTRERAELVARYETARAELGLETVTETQAGIEITLPTALVRFDRYDPPFVHYAERDGSGVQVMLISEPGDQGTLYGLYDILQTLEVVPPEGTRERRESSFTIEGRSDRIASYTHAELRGGLVKGFMLVWHPGDDERMARVLTAMQSSFRSLGNRALDPGLVPLSAEQRRGMLSGLEVRRPRLSRSGIFLTAEGGVLTTAEAVADCRRVTIDHDTEAEVRLADPALGIALLAPKGPLAPRAVAAFRQGDPRPGAPVAVAGYPWQDSLPAPTLTFGALEGLTGLDGEAHLRRLALDLREGDAGGPVLDAAGAVVGMVLPQPAGARRLPEGVAFAVSAEALAARLQQAGITVARSADAAGALAPEDLTRTGDRLTALVSCWE